MRCRFACKVRYQTLSVRQADLEGRQISAGVADLTMRLSRHEINQNLSVPVYFVLR
jgi:hypothetical protein